MDHITSQGDQARSIYSHSTPIPFTHNVSWSTAIIVDWKDLCASRGDLLCFRRRVGREKILVFSGMTARVGGWVRNPCAWAPDVAFSVFCIIAVVFACRATRAVEWPCDQTDMYRDIAIAQTALDGDFQADYAYAGEKNWYNPLAGLIVAGVSWLTRASTPVVDTRVGPFANLLVPISLYLLVSLLLGRWAALAACAFFIFGTPLDDMSFLRGTYSPWLRAGNITQFAFFVSLICYFKSLDSPAIAWKFATGAFLGLTFIGHTAPALMCGGIVALDALRKTVAAWTDEADSPDLYRAITGFAVIVAVALLASAPYAWPLYAKYRFHIVNEAVAQWMPHRLWLENMPSFVAQLLHPSNLLAGLGLFGLAFTQRHRNAHFLILSWLGLALAGITYNYLVQGAHTFKINLPSIVTAHHFLQYAATVRCILLGFGLVLACRMMVSAARVSMARVDACLRARPQWLTRVEGFLCLTTVILYVSFAAPTYGSWADVRNPEGRMTAYAKSELAITPAEWTEIYHWLRANCKPSDVFLCDDNSAVDLVSPAGIKVVCSAQHMSNPYVPFEPRDKDRRDLFQSLATDNRGVFLPLARKYGLTHILIPRQQADKYAKAVEHAWVEQVFCTARMAIYRVNPIQSM